MGDPLSSTAAQSEFPFDDCSSPADLPSRLSAFDPFDQPAIDTAPDDATHGHGHRLLPSLPSPPPLTGALHHTLSCASNVDAVHCGPQSPSFDLRLPTPLTRPLLKPTPDVQAYVRESRLLTCKAKPLVLPNIADLHQDFDFSPPHDCTMSKLTVDVLGEGLRGSTASGAPALSADPAALSRAHACPSRIRPETSHGSLERRLQPGPDVLTPPAESEPSSWIQSTIRDVPGGHATSSAPSETPVVSFGAPTPADSDASTSDAAGFPLRGAQTWLQPALELFLDQVDMTRIQSNQIRVLSQALPLPSLSGHYFPTMIKALRVKVTPSPLTWINLIHALPGRLKLADLPTTPPTTPGMPLESDDYFTTKVFDCAVPSIDYDQIGLSGGQLSRNLAPPASINLSIVERYIPPTSSRESADMYSVAGPSLLVDRLVELSPDNGSLVFIYPTRQGGQTFMSACLSPVLDPVLRSMVIRYELSSDFSVALGRMQSVQHLSDFEDMARQTAQLCEELGKANRSRLQGTGGKFSVIYGGKHEVRLPGSVWTKWWAKQEKLWVRSAVMQYFRTSNRLPSAESGKPDVQQVELSQEVLQSVVARADLTDAAAKVEVGVFVIKRAA